MLLIIVKSNNACKMQLFQFVKFCFFKCAFNVSCDHLRHGEKFSWSASGVVIQPQSKVMSVRRMFGKAVDLCFKTFQLIIHSKFCEVLKSFAGQICML